MPRVIIKYNVSPDCVVIHHGVRPRRRVERIATMRPLVDEVVERLSGMYPETTFEAKPSESRGDFEGPGMLLHVTSKDAISPEEQRGVLSVTNAINTDISKVIESYQREFDWLAEGEIDVLRRLRHIRFHDPLSIMEMLDETLGLVQQVVDLTGVCFIIRIHPLVIPKRYQNVQLGSVTPIPSGDGSCIVGCAMNMVMPCTATTLVHEAAHMIQMMRMDWKSEDHGEVFVSQLTRLLQVASGCDWESKARSLSESVRPVDDGVIRSDRWTMIPGGREGEWDAVWYRDGVSSVGEESMRCLDDEEKRVLDGIRLSHPS